MRLSDTGAGRDTGTGSHVAAVALFAIVILVVLFLVIFGSSVYRSAVAHSAADDSLRATQGYIDTHIQAADAQDAISIGEGPQGSALVISEAGDTATYEVRIYAYEGALVEEYARAGSSYVLANAQRITSCSSFEVSWADEASESHRLLKVTTDAGTTFIALRSDGEVG